MGCGFCPDFRRLRAGYRIAGNNVEGGKKVQWHRINDCSALGLCSKAHLEHPRPPLLLRMPLIRPRTFRLAVKWDLENWLPMEGTANRKLLQLIEKLNKEGSL